MLGTIMMHVNEFHTRFASLEVTKQLPYPTPALAPDA
jgi:hypothetical protein